jgi:hypothetical protein
MDFMFTLACGGCAGVNLETGINQFDRISSYSPLKGDAASGYSVGPDYYGMLAFSQAGPGRIVGVDFDAEGLDFSVYAVEKDGGALTVSVIHKEPSQGVRIRVRAGDHFSRAKASWLRGPRLESVDGISFEGSEINGEGVWRLASLERIAVRAGECELAVPAGSAVVLRFGS